MHFSINLRLPSNLIIVIGPFHDISSQGKFEDSPSIESNYTADKLTITHKWPKMKGSRKISQLSPPNFLQIRLRT